MKKNKHIIKEVIDNPNYEFSSITKRQPEKLEAGPIKERTTSLDKTKKEEVFTIQEFANNKQEDPLRQNIEKSITKAKISVKGDQILLPKIQSLNKEKKLLLDQNTRNEAESEIGKLKEFRKGKLTFGERTLSIHKNPVLAEQKIGGAVSSYLTLPIMNYHLISINEISGNPEPKKTNLNEKQIASDTLKSSFGHTKRSKSTNRKHFLQNVKTGLFSMKQIWQSQGQNGYIQISEPSKL